MSTPIKKPTREEAVAWLKQNPDATDAELKAFIDGRPSPSRFRQGLSDIGGSARALVRQGAQGLTFNLADDVVGTIEGALSPNMTMQQGRDRQRGIDRDLRKEHPVASIVGEVGGGVAQGIGAAKLLTKAGAISSLLGRSSMPARMGAGAAAGAAGAGAAGFGSAEGNPLERLPETAALGVLGAVLGGAAPIVGSAGHAIGNATGIRSRMVDPLAESARLVNAANTADKTTAEAIAASAGKNPTVPLTMIDEGGDNLRQLAATAQKKSNTARQTLKDVIDERAEAERDRYISRLSETLNPDDKDIARVAQELRDLRKANADLNYPAALDKTVSDVDVAEFMRIPEVRKAYSEYRESQIIKKADDIPPEIYTIGVGTSGKKTAKLNTVDIPVRALDVVQRAINEAIDAGFRGGKTIPAHRADALKARLTKVLEKVDEIVPEFGEARGIYREDSAAIDALEAGLGNKIKNQHGRKIPNFKTATEAELATWYRTMREAASAGDDNAQAQVENHMLGTFGFLRESLKKKAVPANWLDLPSTQNRIRIVFGNDAKADEFVRALKSEMSAKGSRKVSKAGTTLAEDDAISTPALDLVLAGAAATSGRPYGMLTSIGRLLRAEHTMSPRTADAVIERLTSGANGKRSLADEANILKVARENEERRRAKRAAIGAGAAAGVTGAARN